MDSSGLAALATIAEFFWWLKQTKKSPAPVSVPDPMGNGFKRNRSGEIILSKINEPLLEKIAVETGGAYVRSVLGDRDLQTIYLDQIQQSMEKKDLKSSRRKRWTERFQWWIFAGLLCLAGECWVREK